MSTLSASAVREARDLALLKRRGRQAAVRSGQGLDADAERKLSEATLHAQRQHFPAGR